ncbi:MAG TPA: adenylate/guanylate cyclase domain-containing protein [Candidatus Binatia bacterium]|jgi:class 3 adenylate cyclase|nr:adenylate/guanylate cyclase domain-containing protein [Candidatus Binatia bacterium]
MRPPQTHYARSGDVNIAYQVFGNGPIDLVHVPPFVSNLELQWQDPNQARYFRRLAAFSRLIMFDKRGTGLSDRTGIASLEERMDDLRAVMDAVGSMRAVVFGNSEGGAMSLLFAATYPDRVTALVLYGAYPRIVSAPDYPEGHSPETREQLLEAIGTRWGQGAMEIGLLAPSHANDPAFLEAQASWERLSASPGAAIALLRMILEIDVRHLLPAIQVPTLVIYRTADILHAAGSRYLGTHIPGAKTIELPGEDYYPHLGDQNAILDEVEEFLTGVRPVPESDRVLATVLFTDIVGSTERAAALGDTRWRELLEAHHELVRKELARYRGQEVDTAGDGFLATFDGPGRAVRCAVAIRDGVHRLGIEIRAGLHTGECELIAGKVGGFAVHVGARVAATAQPGQIIVSSTVKDLVAGSSIRFTDLGVHALKGIPEEWRLFAAEEGAA